MKNPHKILIILFVLFNFTFINGNAQQTDENTFIINQYFQGNKEAAALLENKVAITSANEAQYNLAKLNQIGNNNQIDIKSRLDDVQAVSQFGNNNVYQFINYYNSSVANFSIIQQGNSNSLQIYGENSLIKNLSIVQKGNFETLIIKNY